MNDRDITAFWDIMNNCSYEHARMMADNIPIPTDGFIGAKPVVDWVLAISGCCWM